jgi:hypothetical protein
MTKARAYGNIGSELLIFKGDLFMKEVFNTLIVCCTIVAIVLIVYLLA